MLINNHNIYLYVNGKSVDLESENSLGLRFNDVLFNPEKISNTSASYSFEFEVPTTVNNNKIFDYANVLSKNNKFHQRYNAEVESDGRTIFEGTLIINSVKEMKYHCNLVDVKTYNLDEIFKELKLTDIPWYLEFSGVTSINDYNANLDEVKFPLVSYGVFAKTPYYVDDIGNEYTDKFTFDKYNKWYVSSFYPSVNVLSSVKKAFEWKGYQVFGDAFADSMLKNVYMSTYLDSEQVPTYNVGNPAFGQVDVEINYTTGDNDYIQELQFPYERVRLRTFSDTGEDEYYNYDNVLIHDILTSGVTTNQSPCYMYQPNEHIIVIPKSGFYKIELSVTCSSNTSSITAALHTTNQYGDEWQYNNMAISKSLSGLTPIEIALVRNYDDNYELIKGKNNVEYKYGNPTSGKTEWLTCFPHEDPVQAKLPTKKNDLAIVNQTRMGGKRGESSGGGSRGGTFSASTASRNGGTRGTRAGTIDPTGGGRVYSDNKVGYIPGDNSGGLYDGYSKMMCVDQAVSPSFICGLSSYLGGTPSVARNGYSWSRSTSIKNEVFAPVDGYKYAWYSGGTSPNLVLDDTVYNKNSYINTPFFGGCKATNTGMTGNTSCMMWLEKDDILNLFAVQRAFFDQNGAVVRYPVKVQAHLKITAFSNKSYDDIKARQVNDYYSNIEFETRLKVSDFMNSGITISSYIQGISDAFNLDIVQNGKTIRIDKRKKLTNDLSGVVDIDNRVSNDEVETSRINYPKSMSIKYKVDKEEWGFEKTVPTDKINLPDWDNYGDSGYTIIYLSDDDYVTETSDISTNYSYTYYDTFTWVKVDTGHTEESGTTTTFDIPVISKSLPMVSGYSYDEAMKVDGYSLNPRFWFKPVQQPYVDSQMHSLPTYLYTDTYPQEKVYIYTPVNQMNGINLSYKTTEKSLLELFNIQAKLESNYAIVNVYLSADEYNLLKNGGKVKLDDDLYDVVEIQGYSPDGNNTTELKLMKRVV